MTAPGAAPHRRGSRWLQAAAFVVLATTVLALPLAARTSAPAAPGVAITVPTPEQRLATLAAIDASIKDGRLAAAGDIIARARQIESTPQLQLRSAELALATGDLAGAATQFTDLVGQAEVAAAAQQGLGIARLRQGNVAAATIAIDAALAADASLARAWNARGVMADQRRDWATADKAYGQAIALDPQSAHALTNRGYSLMLRGHYAEAEADLAAAVKRDPKLTIAQTDLRFARAMQGRYQDAFAGSTRENLANDLNTVGFAAMARGDRETAETYFERAMSLSTRFDHVAWANLQYLKSNGRLPAEAGDAGLAAAEAVVLSAKPPR